MADGALEAPESADELYYARGDEVDSNRPLLTGDVVADVPIAGISDGNGLAVILEHPCSMREDGINLMPTMLACRVEAVQLQAGKGAWRGNYSYMPLPALRDHEDQDSAANLLKAGRIGTDGLSDRRIAALSPHGISLLMQRLTNFLTRVVVGTQDLDKAIGHFIEEVDQLEEWSNTAVSSGKGPSVEEFMEFIRQPREGATLQECFRHSSKAAYARREIRGEIARRFRSTT